MMKRKINSVDWSALDYPYPKARVVTLKRQKPEAVESNRDKSQFSKVDWSLLDYPPRKKSKTGATLNRQKPRPGSSKPQKLDPSKDAGLEKTSLSTNRFNLTTQQIEQAARELKALNDSVVINGWNNQPIPLSFDNMLQKHPWSPTVLQLGPLVTNASIEAAINLLSAQSREDANWKRVSAVFFREYYTALQYLKGQGAIPPVAVGGNAWGGNIIPAAVRAIPNRLAIIAQSAAALLPSGANLVQSAAALLPNGANLVQQGANLAQQGANLAQQGVSAATAIARQSTALARQTATQYPFQTAVAASIIAPSILYDLVSIASSAGAVSPAVVAAVEAASNSLSAAPLASNLASNSLSAAPLASNLAVNSLLEGSYTFEPMADPYTFEPMADPYTYGPTAGSYTYPPMVESLASNLTGNWSNALTENFTGALTSNFTGNLSGDVSNLTFLSSAGGMVAIMTAGAIAAAMAAGPIKRAAAAAYSYLPSPFELFDASGAWADWDDAQPDGANGQNLVIPAVEVEDAVDEKKGLDKKAEPDVNKHSERKDDVDMPAPPSPRAFPRPVDDALEEKAREKKLEEEEKKDESPLNPDLGVAAELEKKAEENAEERLYPVIPEVGADVKADEKADEKKDNAPENIDTDDDLERAARVNRAFDVYSRFRQLQDPTRKQRIEAAQGMLTLLRSPGSQDQNYIGLEAMEKELGENPIYKSFVSHYESHKETILGILAEEVEEKEAQTKEDRERKSLDKTYDKIQTLWSSRRNLTSKQLHTLASTLTFFWNRGIIDREAEYDVDGYVDEHFTVMNDTIADFEDEKDEEAKGALLRFLRVMATNLSSALELLPSQRKKYKSPLEAVFEFLTDEEILMTLNPTSEADVTQEILQDMQRSDDLRDLKVILPKVVQIPIADISTLDEMSETLFEMMERLHKEHQEYSRMAFHSNRGGVNLRVVESKQKRIVEAIRTFTKLTEEDVNERAFDILQQVQDTKEYIRILMRNYEFLRKLELVVRQFLRRDAGEAVADFKLTLLELIKRAKAAEEAAKMDPLKTRSRTKSGTIASTRIKKPRKNRA